MLYTHCWQHLFGNPLNRTSPTSLAFEPNNLAYGPIKTALADWKTLWDDTRARMTSSAVNEMGFETSADSYWTLTKMIVQRFEGRNAGHAAASVNSNGTPPSHTTVGGLIGNDEAMSEASSNGIEVRGSSPSLDFMPLEADCDSHGAHLRKILKR